MSFVDDDFKVYLQYISIDEKVKFIYIELQKPLAKNEYKFSTAKNSIFDNGDRFLSETAGCVGELRFG